ncbi:hypothetical protein FACUT_2300 [Fusarium acutatum]|uniref:Uncharacterized protein n=1 Tax=Fusarium acutatum TaxID=78861 RepID=A0A8H4K208_9HYPO|nr:hypothetical protein FACUT_2300 [Fusarium acutatum]
MNKDVATVLGDHFRMHPSLFTNYERTMTRNEADGRGHVFTVGQQPAEGAYVHFFASNIGIKAKQGPPKTSIADDLCFYLANYSSLPGLTYETPDIVSLFLQKIVASLYLRHLD